MVDLVLVAAAAGDLDDDVDAAVGGRLRHRPNVRGTGQCTRAAPPGSVGAMEFRRITNLPPYVFTIINDLKIEARRAGADVDRPRLRQPRHPVAGHRRREAGRGGAQPAQPPLLAEPRPAQAARGDRRLLQAQVGRRPRPRARDHQHDRLEGGLQPPDVGAARPRRRGDRAEPELPDPHLRPAVRRRRPAPGADALPGRPGRSEDFADDFFDSLQTAYDIGWPKPRVLVISFPHNPTGACVDLDVHAAGRRLLPRARDDRRARLRLRRHRLRRLPAAEHPPGRGRQGVRRRAVLDDQELLDGRLARARSCSATPRSCRRSSS